VDAELTAAAQDAPLMDVTDDYGARHRVWAVTGAAKIAAIQQLMATKKLLIADGHHRYETALAYRNENPDNPAAQYVMMTFVNMYSPGLRILATHRVLRNLERFDADLFIANAQPVWTSRACGSVDELKAAMGAKKPEAVRIGVITKTSLHLIERPRAEGELDVPVLHREILETLLGISEEAVRDEKYIHYVRGMDAAAAEVLDKGAQAAFLLEPTPMDDMARIAFGGGVMPQKSTDFYPKLLSGLTIYRV
jgi:uncharacterized protein (DUF1015 family)